MEKIKLENSSTFYLNPDKTAFGPLKNNNFSLKIR